MDGYFLLFYLMFLELYCLGKEENWRKGKKRKENRKGIGKGKWKGTKEKRRERKGEEEKRVNIFKNDISEVSFFCYKIKILLRMKILG